MKQHRRTVRRSLLLLMASASVACGGGETDRSDPLFSRGTLAIETDRGPVVLTVEIAETRRARAT
jgi:hypothetical protein